MSWLRFEAKDEQPLGPTISAEACVGVPHLGHIVVVKDVDTLEWEDWVIVRVEHHPTQDDPVGGHAPPPRHIVVVICEKVPS